MTKFSASIDMLEGMINFVFVLQSFNGRCYGDQLIWGIFANVIIDHLQSLLWRSKT